MPKFVAKRSALAVAVAAAAAALALAPAAHADSPAGQHLVAFSKVPSETKSVLIDRSNNTSAPGSRVCLRNLPSGQSYSSSVHVDNDSTPDLTFYSSGDCSRGAQSAGFIDVHQDNLTKVWVSWRNYHPYWGRVGLAS
ncbi:hypothetical protein UK23_34835 [Lentzea aerocolonigenes]|uniref:Uncharacterized protein n=1 Tax=Lentzea aerocolonigenes TaxID=68170 RepID=A0A0F0GHM4_LENAE|nr:hypothetical protein [Lentzea aerocolonigenes]KJK43019.1 hypothetical protein UK23_34835 [Lentzea aerocolonigenes]